VNRLLGMQRGRQINSLKKLKICFEKEQAYKYAEIDVSVDFSYIM
jgi:hypothetical protein